MIAILELEDLDVLGIHVAICLVFGSPRKFFLRDHDCYEASSGHSYAQQSPLYSLLPSRAVLLIR